MPTYVILTRYTDEGMRNFRDAPARSREAIERARAAGIEVIATYYTQGEYDAVTILEAPDEDAFLAGLIATEMEGNVRTSTMRAFSIEQMERIVGRIGGEEGTAR